MALARAAVLALTVLALLLAWVYFRRLRIPRPPLGIFGLWDVAVLLVGIVLMPYLYLLVPVAFASALLGLGMLSVLALASEPLVPHGRVRWMCLIGLLATDVWASIADADQQSIPIRFMVNDLLLILVIVSMSNMWAQSGLRARDAAVLGAGLAVYDLLFTAVLPITDDLIRRLAGVPFAPLVAWPTGSGAEWFSIGLGDLLLGAVFPLVMRKAFGLPAGLVALLSFCLVVLILLLAPLSGTFPVMVVVGPLMVLQFLYWKQRRGLERTTWQYLQADS